MLDRQKREAMAGYSETPLLRKLGIKPGFRLCVIGAPRPYAELVENLPSDVVVVSKLSFSVDLVHVFETTRKGLDKHVATLGRALKPDGIAWISWPKKASGVPSEIGENDIRAVALPLGLVDVKVCAVDETWSGLKLVWRVEKRS
jgi:hypothetical protein